MRYEANSPEEYINQLPEERIEPIKKIRQIILDPGLIYAVYR
jgi:hypothetical protein